VIAAQLEYADKVREILEERYYHTTPLAHLHAFGCQQNVADTERLAGLLARMGYGFTDDPAQADFILYNTCAVREHAENRVFGNLGALRHNKRRRPGMIIALCGCMPQQPAVAERIRKSYDHVDIVFGTQMLHALPELLWRTLTEKQRVFSTEEQNAVAEGLPIRRDPAKQSGELAKSAYLPVMYGCDNFCSYCIVPYVRGRERSRTPEAVLEEARGIIAEGYREITLLGQNVNSYGKGLVPGIRFAELLGEVAELPGDFRLKFMTSHPKDATRALIDAMAAHPKVARHLHLPVQSGSDRILDKMNRRYTVEKYLEIIRYAREKMPDIAFTSDIIVGFPGETEEDFEQTLRLLHEVKYDFLFTFIYSRRSGTAAAKLDDPISEEEKGRWFRRLLAEQEAIQRAEAPKRLGNVHRVLVEQKREDGLLFGKTDGGIGVTFAGDELLVGSLVQVKITRTEGGFFGELL